MPVLEKNMDRLTHTPSHTKRDGVFIADKEVKGGVKCPKA
jgi:hypothetical protein